MDLFSHRRDVIGEKLAWILRPCTGACRAWEVTVARRVTREEITRAAQKALEKCARQDSTWTRADLVANVGRQLPRRAGELDQRAALVEEVADRALAGEFGR